MIDSGGTNNRIQDLEEQELSEKKYPNLTITCLVTSHPSKLYRGLDLSGVARSLAEVQQGGQF
jgi:hypothetical protein